MRIVDEVVMLQQLMPIDPIDHHATVRSAKRYVPFLLRPVEAAFSRAGKLAKQRPANDLCFRAGEGIRTLDVQLGKNEPLFSDWFSKPVMSTG